MNGFQVVAHPEPRSFNLALADVARATLEAHGHEVRVSACRDHLGQLDDLESLSLLGY